MIGLGVKHVNEAKLCCSSWPSGLSASRVTSIDLDISSFLLICLSDLNMYWTVSMLVST
jgi:hypothetical protein